MMCAWTFCSVCSVFVDCIGKWLVFLYFGGALAIVFIVCLAKISIVYTPVIFFHYFRV